MRKALLFLTIILFSKVALCQTENELNGMIIESVSKFIDADMIYYKYPRKEIINSIKGKRSEKIVIDTLYYCVDGLPSLFEKGDIVIKGAKPITIENVNRNYKRDIKNLRNGTDIIFTKYYIHGDEIIISLKKRVVRIPDRKHIQITDNRTNMVITFVGKPYGIHGFDVKGFQETLFTYRYSCESNSWEFVGSR